MEYLVHLSLTPIVDLHTVDDPVRIRKRSWVCCNVIDAACILRGVILIATGLLPEVVLPRIAPAESGIKDNLVVLEVVGCGAITALGVESGRAKGRRIGLAILDGLWNLVWWEVPHLDEV